MKKIMIALFVIMILLTIGFASASLGSDAPATYRMDNSSAPISNDGFNSAVAGLALTGSATYQVNGLIDYATYFGNGSNYMKSANAVFGNNSDFTINMWVNANVSQPFSSNGLIAHVNGWTDSGACGANNGGAWDLRYGPSGLGYGKNNQGCTVELNEMNTTYTSASYGGVWRMITLNVKGWRAEVYFDGVLAVNGTNSAVNPKAGVDTAQIIIRQNYQDATNGGLNGQYDEITYFNRSITLNEINTLYNSGAGLTYPFSTTTPNSIPTVSNINVKSTTGTTSPFAYNQFLKNLTVFINDTDSNVSNITAKLYLYQPDDTIILNGVSLSSISNSGAWVNGTWSYITNILLDRTGTWRINITVNDSIDSTYLDGSFIVNKLSNASITDGYLGYDTKTITSEVTTPKLSTVLSYGFNLIGHKLTYTTFASDWSPTKTAINSSFQQDAKSFIRIDFDDGDYSTYSGECTTLANMSDLTLYPYNDGIAFIVIDVNASASGNISAFINEVSACILSSINNRVPVYTTWSGVGLSADYVSIWNMSRITEASNDSYFATESKYLRNTTSLTRIYDGSTTDFMGVSSTYFKSVIANLRSKPLATAQPSDTRVAKLTNGDVVIFNNASTSIIMNFNTTVYNSDLWDYTNKNFFKSVAGNISLNMSANSASILFADNYSRIVLTDNTMSTMYKAQSFLVSTMNYITGNSGDATLSIVGAYDAREELWQPDFTTSHLEFHSYEALEYSQIVDFSPYEIIGIAKGANTPAIVNASLATSTNIGILNRTYGYISVADYNNTNSTGQNETNCSKVNPWETMKIAEVEDWIANYSVNIFIDGFDIGYSVTPACFNDRIKRLGDYVRYSRQKKTIFNTYTIYQDVSNYGDILMRESCFSRWNGTVNSPVYSYENMSLMISNSNFVKANNKPVICMAFGDVNDYDKMMWDYYAFATMYGYTTGDGKNNTFRYAQPNFQIQRDIKVPDFGTMMQNTYDTSNSNDWSRRYSGGIVHISPYRNYTFPNGKYYWFDNGQTINSLSLKGRFQIYGSSCSSTHNLNIIVNDNVTKIVDECADVGATQWTANWVTKDFTTSYTDNGHYYVRLYPVSRGEATGMNVYTAVNTVAGVHSWYDSSANNPPTAEADWTAYGRTGTIGDFNTTNFQFNLTINKTYSQAVDSNILIINQTTLSNNDTKKSGNMTLTSSKSINLPVLSNIFTLNTIRNFTIKVNGTILNYSSNSDCLTINPTLTNNVIEGFNHGACEYNDSGIYKARVYAPNMSTHIYVLDEENTAPVITNISNYNISHTQNLSFQVNCSDIDGDTLLYYDNTSLFNINSTGYIFDNPTLSDTGTYNISITCSDGTLNTSTSFIYEITDIAPNVTGVVILPSVAYTSTDLYCIGTYQDADADLENGSSFKWYLNNISVNVTTETLYANTTTLTVGDDVICEYTPSDGLLNGTSINSSIVKIIVFSALSSGGVGTLAVGVYCPQDTFWNGTTCTLDSDKAMTDREKQAQQEANTRMAYYIIGGFIALILLFKIIKRKK